MGDSDSIGWQHTMGTLPPEKPQPVNLSQQALQECHMIMQTVLQPLGFSTFGNLAAQNTYFPELARSQIFLPQTRPKHKPSLLLQDLARAADHTQPFQNTL